MAVCAGAFIARFPVRLVRRIYGGEWGRPLLPREQLGRHDRDQVGARRQHRQDRHACFLQRRLDLRLGQRTGGDRVRHGGEELCEAGNFRRGTSRGRRTRSAEGLIHG